MLKQNKVEFRSLKENLILDENPRNMLMIQMLGAFAEFDEPTSVAGVYERLSQPLYLKNLAIERDNLKSQHLPHGLSEITSDNITMDQVATNMIWLKIDTRKSSLGEGPKNTEAGPFELGADEPLKLQVFVDKSVVEVFANDRQAVMRRIYPTRANSLGVKLFSKGGSAKVKKLQAWDMMPSNAH